MTRVSRLTVCGAAFPILAVTLVLPTVAFARPPSGHGTSRGISHSVGHGTSHAIGHHTTHRIGSRSTHGISHSSTRGSTHSFGHGVTQGISHGISQGISHAIGHRTSHGITHSTTQGFSHNLGHVIGHSIGHKIGRSSDHGLVYGQAYHHDRHIGHYSSGLYVSYRSYDPYYRSYGSYGYPSYAYSSYAYPSYAYPSYASTPVYVPTGTLADRGAAEPYVRPPTRGGVEASAASRHSGDDERSIPDGVVVTHPLMEATEAPEVLPPVSEEERSDGAEDRVDTSVPIRPPSQSGGTRVSR